MGRRRALSAMRMEGAEYRRLRPELAMDPGSIGEYLVNEVLRDQPEPQRKLLMKPVSWTR